MYFLRLVLMGIVGGGDAVDADADATGGALEALVVGAGSSVLATAGMTGLSVETGGGCVAKPEGLSAVDCVFSIAA